MSARVILAFAFLSVTAFADAEAQRRPAQIELSGGYGFTFGGGGSTREGNLSIAESGSWGFNLNVPVRRDTRIEAMYWRQNTQAEFQPFVGTPSSADVAVEYWQLGAVGEMPQGNVVPFGVFTLGTSRLIGKGDLSGSEFRFAGTLGGGIKIAGDGAVGARLEGRLLLTARNTGSSFWCGTGGCAIGLVGNPIAQGVFSASVFVKVGGPR